MTDSSQKARAAVTLTIATLTWASARVFIRFLSDAYDPFTQAYVRYLSGAVVLLVVSWIGFREEFIKRLFSPGPIFFVAMLNAFQQVIWTLGCYGAPATVAQLVVKFNVVVIIILSYFIFHEERGVITSRGYLGGTAASLVGVTMVLTREPGALAPILEGPSLLLIATALCWAVYLVWSKHIVATVHPVPMFSVLAIYTTLALGLFSWGYRMYHPEAVVYAGLGISLVTFVSGILPIAIAHTTYNHAQKYLGAAFCGTILLLSPFVTYLMALAVLRDEYLTPWQWAGGIILTAGTLVVTWARAKSGRKTGEPVQGEELPGE